MTTRVFTTATQRRSAGSEAGGGPHHAGAAAGRAALHLAAWLVTFTVAALAGCVDVNRDFLVDALCCLSERQLHDVLYSKRQQMPCF